MGVFDQVIFKGYAFPEPQLQDKIWQTNDLDNHLELYTVDQEGKLQREEGDEMQSWIRFTGTIRLICYWDNNLFPEYAVTFEHGVVTRIEAILKALSI